jgi:excisionase family DNA binding protein
MKLLNRKEVAEILRCDEKTIKYYVSSRQIPFVMVGKEARFIEESIINWLLQRQVSPAFELTKGV